MEVGTSRLTAGAANRGAILVSCTHSELARRIATLASVKKERNCQSNQEEFCIIGNEATGCSRIDVKKIPRKLQIKTSRVENLHGPLDRLHKPGGVVSLSPAAEGVEERLRNMEQHLNLAQARTGTRDVYDRLKACEDRILELEKVASCRDFLHFERLKKKLKEQGVTDTVEVGDAYTAAKQLEQEEKRKDKRTWPGDKKRKEDEERKCRKEKGEAKRRKHAEVGKRLARSNDEEEPFVPGKDL